MFNNKKWQLRLINQAKTLGLLDRNYFRSSVINMCKKFQRQWGDSHQVARARLDEIQAEFSNEYLFNAMWNNLDLNHFLAQATYQVFEELGQTKTLQSQVDCRSKLDKLNLAQIEFAEKSVLDIGCSTGWFLKEYGKLRARRLVGVDINAKNCEFSRNLLAKIYCHSNFNIVQCDALDFSGEKFDVITALSMFHYIERKQRFFDHIGSLLNSGGTFVLETPVNEGGPDVTIWDLKPARYVPSLEFVKKLGMIFDLAYIGRSNLRGAGLENRWVFHFKKR